MRRLRTSDPTRRDRPGPATDSVDTILPHAAPVRSRPRTVLVLLVTVGLLVAGAAPALSGSSRALEDAARYRAASKTVREGAAACAYFHDRACARALRAAAPHLDRFREVLTAAGTTREVAPPTTTSPTTGPAATTASGGSGTPWPDGRGEVGLAGAGVAAASLPTFRGDRTITTDGAVIHDVRITDRLHVDADNVTIRRVDFAGTSIQAIKVERGAANVVIEDSDFHGGWEKGIDAGEGDHVTIRRNAMWGIWRCGDPSPHGIVADNYCTPNVTTGSDAHTSGWGTGGGTNHVVITRNYTDATSSHTSTALPIYNDYGSNDDWLVTDNYWNCRCSYVMYPGGSNTNIRIVGNTLGSDAYYGYVHSWSGSSVTGPAGNERGNIWDRNVDERGRTIRL